MAPPNNFNPATALLTDLEATSETGLAEMILDIDSVSVTYKSLSRIIQNLSIFER